MNILLVGSHHYLNQTISNILGGEEDFEIKTVSPETLERQHAELAPTSDLMIADLASFDFTPVDTVYRLKVSVPSSRILVISEYTHPKLIRPLLEAGADAHIPLFMTEKELLTTLKSISGLSN